MSKSDCHFDEGAALPHEEKRMYEMGVLAAFLLWIYSLVMIVANANSQLARNLSKVGMRLSWLTAEPVPAGDRSGAGWRVFSALAFTGLGLVGILLSWLTVVASIGMLIHRASKSNGMPQVVKELRWKLRNVEMTREQVLTEMAAVQSAVLSSATTV